MMIDILPYLLKVSISFSLLYIAFWLCFRKLSFHWINRILLLSFIPIACWIPLIEFPIVQEMVVEHSPLAGIPSFVDSQEQIATGFTTKHVSEGIMLTNIFGFLYMLGLLVAVIRVGNGFRRYMVLKKASTIIFKGSYTLRLADIPSIFSFFSNVFIPRQLERDKLEPILMHEKAHIKLGHTFDLILLEVYSLIFWFNPLVYAYRSSLKAIHEFQADEAVLKNNTSLVDYLQLLLTHVQSENTHSLYSYFNHPILKNRIMMMTKSKTKPLKLLSYLSMLPVLGLLSMAFMQPTYKTPLSIEISYRPILLTPPSLFPVKGAGIEEITAGFRQNIVHPITKEKVDHQGIDIRAAEGTEVIATETGTITKAKFDGDWGNLIIIAHADGYTSYYAHLRNFKVKEGQIVKKGETIGYVGNTGKSKGPHLHYEVRLNNKQLDPMKFIQP